MLKRTAAFCLFFLSLLSFVFASSANDYLKEGLSLFEDEYYYLAIDAYQNAIDVNPYYGDAYRAMAEAYYALKAYEEAIDYGEMALNYSHDDVEAMLLVANSYRELGETDEAEELYEEIKDDYPSNFELYRNFALLYLEMNKNSSALTMLQKAWRYEDDSWEVAMSMGDYYYNTGDLDEAEEWYQAAFELDSREREVFFRLADYYYVIGEYDEAILLLEEGREFFNNFVSGISLLGDCYLATEDFSSAFECFEWLEENASYREDEELAELYFRMALCSTESDEDGAVDYFQDAMDYDDEDELIRFAYETFVTDNYDIDDDLREELSDDYYELALKDYRRGDISDYIYHLKRSIYLYPYNEDARFELVDYYELQKDYTHAYDELSTLFRLDSSATVRDKIEAYDWKIDYGTLELTDSELYEYEGLFIVQGGSVSFDDVYTDLTVYYARNFDKLKLSTFDYRQTEGVNTILSEVRQEDYHFFVIADYDEDDEEIEFTLYDSSGTEVDSTVFVVERSGIEESVFRFLKWMDDLLPDMAVINEKQSDGDFVVSYGSASDVEEGDELVAYKVTSRAVEEVARFTVESANLFESECALTEDSSISGSDWEDLIVLNSDYLIKKDLTKLKRVLLY